MKSWKDRLDDFPSAVDVEAVEKNNAEIIGLVKAVLAALDEAGDYHHYPMLERVLASMEENYGLPSEGTKVKVSDCCFARVETRFPDEDERRSEDTCCECLEPCVSVDKPLEPIN